MRNREKQWENKKITETDYNIYSRNKGLWILVTKITKITEYEEYPCIWIYYYELCGGLRFCVYNYMLEILRQRAI